jgi:hypothetical protein
LEQALKHAIFSIRYSLFNPEGMGNWKIGRGVDLQKYKETLFNQSRLALRRKTLSQITLPSINAAAGAAPDIKTEVHILTSTELPESEKEFLSKVSEDYPIVKIFYFDPDSVDLLKGNKEYLEGLGPEEKIASIRIDDDDAISKDFLSRLSSWMNLEIDSFALSMCSGLGLLIDDDLRVVGVGEYKSRLIAAGLAYIYSVKNNKQISIYQLGNHTMIDERVPVILDASGYSFIRTFHPSNDSKDSFDRAVRDPAAQKVNPELLKGFHVLA